MRVTHARELPFAVIPSQCSPRTRLYATAVAQEPPSTGLARIAMAHSNPLFTATLQQPCWSPSYRLAPALEQANSKSLVRLLLRTPHLWVSIKNAAFLDSRDSVPLFTFRALTGEFAYNLP